MSEKRKRKAQSKNDDAEFMLIVHARIYREHRTAHTEMIERLFYPSNGERDDGTGMVEMGRRDAPAVGDILEGQEPIALPSDPDSAGLRSEPVPSSDWVFIRNEGDRSLWKNTETGEQEWFLLKEEE